MKVKLTTPITRYMYYVSIAYDGNVTAYFYHDDYSRTCPQDHLRLKTTCVKRLPFQGPKSAILTVFHLC